MSDGWLSKRIMFRNLDGAVWRGRGGKGKIVDRLRTEQCPGICHSGGLESDWVEGRGVN